MKYSIIVPVYNAEKFILNTAACLANLVSNKEYEVIFINDGSTDNSYSLLQDRCKLFSNIKVFTKENGGASSARNFGISKASGEYIIFVDSDDWIDSDFLQKIETVITDTNGSYDLYQYGIKTTNGNTDVDNFVFSEQWDIENLDKIYPTLWHSPCTKVIKKSFIDNNNILFRTDLISCEDMIFSLNLYLNTDRIFNIVDYSPYHYLQHGESLTHSNLEKLYNSELSAIKNFDELNKSYPHKVFDRMIKQKKLSLKLSNLSKNNNFNIQRYRNTFPEMTGNLLFKLRKSTIIFWLIFLHMDKLALLLLKLRDK